MRNHEDWLKAYMQYSSYSEAPTPFHFWTGVSTIAGALRRQVFIDMGYFKWLPNFYIVLVAPPGIVQKSSTADIGMSLLRQVQGITFGPQSTTWQSLVASLAESTVPVGGLDNPGKPVPMSAITIAASEFGTFMNLQDNEMIDVLVDLWDGKEGTWEKKTKTQGSDKIKNPWINIIACTTPSWISGNFPEYMIHGGFASRTIFIYADRKQKRVAYPSRIRPPEILELEKTLVADLRQMSKLVGEMKLTEEAFSYGEEWYNQHMDFVETTNPEDRLGGFYARKQTHIHKLAMVISASRRDTLTIEKTDLEASVRLVDSIEAAIPKVFSKITSQEARGTGIVLALIDHYGRLSQRQAFQKLLEQMSYRDFMSAIQACVAAGRLRSSIENGEAILVSVKKERENAQLQDAQKSD